MPVNLCTETLNFCCHTWLCPRSPLCLWPSLWVGARGQANTELLGLPSPRSHPGTGVLATRTLLSEPGPGLRHALISCINSVGVRRMGKAAGACCLVRIRTLLPAPCAPLCSSALPALRLATGWVAAALLPPSILPQQVSVSVAPHVQLAGCWIGTGEARHFEPIQ